MSDFVEILKNVIAHRIAPDRLRDPVAEILGGSGTWTPTITFATPGTLSVSYALQEGFYWRVGPLVHVAFRVDFTPTLGTATDDFRLQGFPFVSASSRDVMWPLNHGANLAYPAGMTSMAVRMRNNLDYWTVDGSGGGVATASLTAADFTTGQAQSFVPGGVYQTAAS